MDGGVHQAPMSRSGLMYLRAILSNIHTENYGTMFKLYVGNLDVTVDKTAMRIKLLEMFSTYGPIIKLDVVKNRYEPHLKGYAFVHFVKNEDAVKALELNHQFLDGRQIKVRDATQPVTAVTATTTAISTAVATKPKEGEKGDLLKIAKRLFVGNLDTKVDRETMTNKLHEIFSLYGPIEYIDVKPKNKSKIRDFGYVQFARLQDATTALENVHYMDGRQLKVDKDTSIYNFTNKKYTIVASKRVYVGKLDLNKGIGPLKNSLLQAFMPYGPIETIRINRNSETGEYVNYGFIKFVNAEDAKNAVKRLRGSCDVDGQKIRVGLATKKNE
ncbi:hypothetical protein DMENIID0001_089660 [Sergentomyia squamirostris]